MSAEVIPEPVSDATVVVPGTLDEVPDMPEWAVNPPHRDGSEVEVVPDDVVEETAEPTDVQAELSMLVPETGEAITTDDGTEGAVGGADSTPEFDGTVTLTTGHVVNIRPIKTQQFLKMVKIFMQGAPEALPLLVPDQDDFKGMLQAVLINAAGNAPDAAISFIQGAVQIPPAAFEGKSQKEKETMVNEIYGALQDPEIEDTLEIIGGIIQLDGDHLEALGKRVVAMAKKPLPR